MVYYTHVEGTECFWWENETIHWNVSEGPSTCKPREILVNKRKELFSEKSELFSIKCLCFMAVKAGKPGNDVTTENQSAISIAIIHVMYALCAKSIKQICLVI